MKRILCFIFCVLMLASVCSLTALAADEPQKSVMEDLSTLYIDGEQFNEADYPFDTSDKNMYILTVVEKGFLNTSSSPDFALYIYVYNPSGMLIKDKLDNSVQIGANADCTEYSFYGLRGQSMSADRRFIRFKVDSYGTNSIANLYKNQKQSNERVYNIACLRLYAGSGMERFKTVKTVRFKGLEFNGTIECDFASFEALDVDFNLTSWVSPNAGSFSIYNHYDVRSLYFRIPKAYFEDNFDFIYSIRAAFDVYKLTPIIVSRPGDLTSSTVSAIENGDKVLGGSADVMDLYWDGGYFLPETCNFYTESEWLKKEWTASYHHYLDCLAFLFLNSDIPEDYNMEYGTHVMAGISEEQLKSYFYEKINDSSFDSSKLYSTVDHLEIDYYSKDSGGNYLYNFHTFMENKTEFDEWCYKFYLKDDSYVFEDFNTTCEKIKVITDPSQYSNYESLDYKNISNGLFINENDLPGFSATCADAVANDEYVVMLRFGLSNYLCSPVYDAWEAGVTLWKGKQVAYAIEKSIYRNISLLHIVFSKDGELVTIPTVSNVADSFGDSPLFENPIDRNPVSDDKEDDVKNWWEELLEKIKELLAKMGQALKWTGVVLLCVALVWIGVKVWLWIRGVRLTKKLQDKDKERLNDQNRKE